jgi:ribosomal protein S18 acetylase RimI-like enzyme
VEVSGTKWSRPPTIRPARADDYQAIAAVWEAAGLKADRATRDGESAFVRQLKRFPASYLVAVDGNAVIGVVLGTHDERKGWINRLAVLPAYQGCGVATALVRACDAAIRAEGIHIVSALVEPGNKSSGRVFEKVGYRTDVEVLYFRKVDRPDVERH